MWLQAFAWCLWRTRYLAWLTPASPGGAQPEHHVPLPQLMRLGREQPSLAAPPWPCAPSRSLAFYFWLFSTNGGVTTLLRLELAPLSTPLPGPGLARWPQLAVPRTKWVRLPQGTRSGLLSAQLMPGVLLAQRNCLNALPKLSSPTFCPPRPSTPPLQAPFISTAPSLGDGHSLFQILASRNILVSTRATPSNDSSYADRLKRWFRFLGSFFSPNSGMNATTCYKASD